MDITFEQLPKVVSDIYGKLEAIERLLIQRPITISKEPEELLTITQASEFISLSVPTVYSLVQRSEIPVNKKGKRLYFSKQELIDWIKTGRKKTASEISIETRSYSHKKKSKI